MAKLKDILPTIYVDLDDTLASLKPHADKLLKGKAFGTGRTTKEVWDDLFAADPKFVANQPWVSGSKALWSSIKKYKPVVITKAGPNHRQDVIKQKYEWIKANLGNNVEVIIITYGEKSKHKSVKKGDILIDDSKRNITDWNKSIGSGIHLKSPSQAQAEIKALLDK